MYTHVAASYAPDYHCIRLKSGFPAFADPHNPQGFETPQQAGFFVHEWLHYLHNNSTIHGITAYSHAMIIWSNVRHTLDANGCCGGDEVIPHEDFKDIRKQYAHLFQSRTPKLNELKSGAVLADVRFESCSKQIVAIEDDERYSCTTLECVYYVGGILREKPIRIGCHEIVEYVASALEAKFVRGCGEVPVQAAVAPYGLIKVLANFLAPSLSESTIIRCAVLSLQFTDPPAFLPELLSWANKNNSNGLDPDAELERVASNHIRSNLAVMDDTVSLIEGLFPVDEPFAHAVKYTTEIMRSNYIHRIANPFFELQLVEDLSKVGGKAFEEAMEKFGVGFLIQERPGPAEQFKRDLMYDLSKAAKKDAALSEGQRVWQAALTYTLSMFRDVPGRLTQPRQLRCPLFTACTAEYRRDNPSICNSEPWQTQNTEHSKICHFGRAIINSRLNMPKV
ncbi:hypothetical protein AB3464_01550 [Pseudomonas asplenii]|uniref:hypothetical protein n=1 Tax=Pseudomonas asplenii TaxID=53407 RepID=UPI0037C9F205